MKPEIEVLEDHRRGSAHLRTHDGRHVAVAQDYDVVILNGRVMDPETMFDDIANVGVKDGKIVAIRKISS